MINRIIRLDEAKGVGFLGPLAPYPASQLDVFGHDGDTLGMDGAQVGVLKQTHQVGLASLLLGRERWFVCTFTRKTRV